jgi:hypothetical protein
VSIDVEPGSSEGFKILEMDIGLSDTCVDAMGSYLVKCLSSRALPHSRVPFKGYNKASKIMRRKIFRMQVVDMMLV